MWFQLIHNAQLPINTYYPTQPYKLYNLFVKKIFMKMKNKNCRYYLNPWNKTAFKLSLALDNCYINIFQQRNETK